MFECSQKGEYVLLLHYYFYEILFIGCSKFTVEIRTFQGEIKLLSPVLCQHLYVSGSGSVCTSLSKENCFLS